LPGVRRFEIIAEMAKKDEALELLASGLDPVQIAAQQRVALETILTYLDQMIIAGRLRRTDVLFSIEAEKRRDSADPDTVGRDSWDGPGILRPYAKILERYGSVAHALGDMYEDLRYVEVTLHARILDALRKRFGEGEDGWWRNGLSENLRKKLVGRREEDDSPDDPYVYTDLLDLAEILDKNWGQIGAEVLSNASEKQRLLSDLRRLNQIRRKVMHPVRSKPPSEEEFDFVRSVRKRFGL
jgi:hypothetical protein